MVNPINIAGQFAPLISISFRLWGNIFAGSLIIAMVLSATSSTVDSILPFEFFDFFGLFALLPLHLYFDILSGVIQTLVFCLLTMVYWKMEANTDKK
jgi:F-type H+-transporting ATPase subunit a